VGAETGADREMEREGEGTVTERGGEKIERGRNREGGRERF